MAELDRLLPGEPTSIRQADRGGGMQVLIRLFRLAAALFVSAVLPAHADDIDGWRLGAGDGGIVTASLFAQNFLAAGAGATRYQPMLTIVCNPNGDWSQALQLNEAISGGSLAISVAVDGGGAVTERWTAGERNRVFVREGADGVLRLIDARRLSLSWSLGFLSGRGEADFILSGIKQATATIARDCGLAAP